MVVLVTYTGTSPRTNGPERKQFWDLLAELCVGGVRNVGLDANMAVFGIIQEMAKGGIDVHLCSIHAEYEGVNTIWK